MSDPILPTMERVDPPADVQQAVAAAIEACHAWQPVSVQAPVRETTEASVCGILDGWPANANALGHELLALGAIGGVVGILVLRAAYRAARGFYRIVRARIARKVSAGGLL